MTTVHTSGVRKSYPSDLTDEQWRVLEPLVPAFVPGFERSRHTRREIVNGLLYQARTGCQWRYLPHDLPPWSTLKDYFYAWGRNGTWQHINDALRARVRVRAGRASDPSLGILDSQSTKTTEVGGPKGFDAGKKVKGRKRHLVVDILGLLLVVLVTSAAVQDRDATPRALSEAKAVSPRLTKVLGDGAYTGDVIATASRETAIDFEIRTRPAESRGFNVIPIRWIVERSLAWMNRSRRLSKDYERTCESEESWVRISFIHLMVRRLGRPAGVASRRLFSPAGTIATIAA